MRGVAERYILDGASLRSEDARRLDGLAGELARRFSKRHKIYILEDAAYRELRFDGLDVPSIKSLDRDNAHVILTMTFSKPMAPGLQTG